MKLNSALRPHYAATLRLGIPIAIGQVGVIILGFADTMMVGRYATDALAAAYCHYLEQTRAARLGHAGGGARSWAEFVRQNQNRVSRPTPTRITPELCKKLSK